MNFLTMIKNSLYSCGTNYTNNVIKIKLVFKSHEKFRMCIHRHLNRVWHPPCEATVFSKSLSRGRELLGQVKLIFTIQCLIGFIFGEISTLSSKIFSTKDQANFSDIQIWLTQNFMQSLDFHRFSVLNFAIGIQNYSSPSILKYNIVKRNEIYFIKFFQAFIVSEQ